MTNSDLFVLSSNWEGFGNVLAEALACGIRIVSTDVPSGPSEILNNGEFGILVPPNDPMKLADAILYSLAHEIDVNKQMESAMRFTTKKIAEEYIKLYEERYN